MGYPTKPADAYDYESFQAGSPTTPLPALQVTNDFAGLKAAVDANIDFLIGSFNADGTLKAFAYPGAGALDSYVATATAAATAASASAVAAAASAASVASATALLSGTSTSSLAIGTGAKTFVTQAGKNFVAGQFITAAHVGTPANFMFGQVTSYSGTSLVIDVQVVGGSGTIASWTVSAAGVRGATGATGAAGTPGSTGSEVTGTVRFFTGRVADIPAGNLPLNGVAVARATYPELFALWVRSWTFSVTIAAPGVVSKTGHGLDDGDPFVPTTDGALPTGLVSGTTYYVKAVDADTFQLAATPGGTAITTTGSQSGTHTGTSALCGLGDGSTTFNTQDWRGTTPIGQDMMGTTAAGRLVFATAGVYGRANGQIGGLNVDDVVNVSHSHSYGSARNTGSGTPVYALTSDPADPAYTAITPTTVDNAGSGTTGVSGTASQKYKRVGRVATGIWIVKT